jgi:hypothetical protein
LFFYFFHWFDDEDHIQYTNDNDVILPVSLFCWQ